MLPLTPVLDESSDLWSIHAAKFVDGVQVDEETVCGVWQPHLTPCNVDVVLDKYNGQYCKACWREYLTVSDMAEEQLLNVLRGDSYSEDEQLRAEDELQRRLRK